MVSRTKHENAAAAAAAGAPRAAYSIREFCSINSLSEGTYQNLRKRGLAPRETRVLRRVLITAEAANEWLRSREAASTKTASTKVESVEA